MGCMTSFDRQNPISKTTLWRMAMGTRTSEQSPLWIAASELPRSLGHPFYVRLSAALDAHDFDRFVEDLCSGFYAPVMGRGRGQNVAFARILSGLK
jgi:transposase